MTSISIIKPKILQQNGTGSGFRRKIGRDGGIEKKKRRESGIWEPLLWTLILRLPDPAKTYFLRTDATNNGIGAVLMQRHDEKVFPVCYASKKLSRAERNYSTIEKECLAIVWGIKRFYLYLYGVPFVLQTDHEPLKYMDSAKYTNARLMRWAMFLQSYNFKVEAIKGSENVGADYLSRVEE